MLRDDRGLFGLKMRRSKAVKKHSEQGVPKGIFFSRLFNRNIFLGSRVQACFAIRMVAQRLKATHGGLKSLTTCLSESTCSTLGPLFA